jgi:hypothetical protein
MPYLEFNIFRASKSDAFLMLFKQNMSIKKLTKIFEIDLNPISDLVKQLIFDLHFEKAVTLSYILYSFSFPSLKMHLPIGNSCSETNTRLCSAIF